jgi:hypothetical protein
VSYLHVSVSFILLFLWQLQYGCDSNQAKHQTMWTLNMGVISTRQCSLSSAAFSQGKWVVSGVCVAYELLRLELLSRMLSCVNLVSDSCFLMLVYHWTFLIFRCFCHDISLTKTCENYIVFMQYQHRLIVIPLIISRKKLSWYA